MPRYRIKIEGRDIEATAYKGPPLCGFFVTRLVDAPTAQEAQASALASVEQDWRVGRYSQWKQSPSLIVVECGKAGLFTWLTANFDYIFHRGR